MKPQLVFFVIELLGPSLIINLAQLVSPSVALPAELVFNICENIWDSLLIYLGLESQE